MQPPHFIDAAQRGPVPAEIGSETTPSPKRPRGRLAAVLALLVLALAGGGYGVEIVTSSGLHQLTGVTTGIFAGGRVQVSGRGIAPGVMVVVAQ